MRRLLTLCAVGVLVVLALTWGLGCQADPAVQHYDRGVNLAKAGQYEQAIAEFDKAIELDPNYTAAYANRGNVYSQIGQHDKAIADCNKAIELDPDDAEVYGNRAAVYSHMGEHDKAIADYNKAIELDPNYAQAYYNRGIAYSSLGEYDKAIADYTKAIELNPNYAKAYYNRGLAYKAQGREAEAMADFQMVVTFVDAPELVKQAQQQAKNAELKWIPTDNRRFAEFEGEAEWDPREAEIDRLAAQLRGVTEGELGEISRALANWHGGASITPIFTP
jgi:tetratricopeptide (TPR) repeat protein